MSANNGTTGYSVLYDGDGNKISTTIGDIANGTIINGTTTILVGNYYEWSSDATWKKYYSANGQNIAVRDQTGVQYLYGDNLGSVRGWSNSNGTSYGSQRYMPWGEDGTVSQSPAPLTPAVSDRKYTGQRDLASLGIYDYNARYYDPYLNRFLQPDSVIPNAYNPISYDRYAYVQNSPTNFNDPLGHSPCGDWDACKEESYPLTPPPYLPTPTSYPTLSPLKPIITSTPQTVLRAGSTNTPTPTVTPTPLPPEEIAKQMAGEVAEYTSPFRYDPGTLTKTDLSSVILSGAQSISMSYPTLSWVYPAAQIGVGIATAIGAGYDISQGVETWWSNAYQRYRPTQIWLQTNGPTKSPTLTPTSSSTPGPTHTPTFPPPHW